MNNFQRDVIALIKSAITFQKVSLSSDVDWQRIFNLAKKHQIFPLIYYGAVNLGIALDADMMKLLEMYTLNYLMIDQRQLYELAKIENAFEDNGIDYMLLKGARLKSLYPKTDMRIMGDADILIKTEQYGKIKRILPQLGYTKGVESDHELIWKNKLLYLELHKRIIPTRNKDFYPYFGTGWKFATQRVEHGFAMTPEDEFVYIFVHFAKHYRDGGIGLKQIADIWVYLSKYTHLDEEYIKKCFSELKMYGFYKNVLKVLKVWFENEDSNDITDTITDKIFESDGFGTQKNINVSTALQVSAKYENLRFAKLRRIFSVVFLPYGSMCLKYPFLKKAAVLLPFMWVIRWIHIVLFRRKKISEQLAKIDSASKEDITRFRDDLRKVGLDFNFKEK